MLCMKNRNDNIDEYNGSVPVYLNVYDLTSINGYAYWLGFGVYHSGVEVHGVEYAFGAHENPTTGIYTDEPKQCEGFKYRKTILIGKTEMSHATVRRVMEDLADEYRGNAYNLIIKNCNHFCNAACVRLTGNPIPSWVNRLANIGVLCNCVLPMRLNSTKIGHHWSKVSEDDREKLRSSSSRFPSSSNSSLSSSSSSSGNPTSRGRNINRKTTLTKC